MTTATKMKVKALAPWYGSFRMGAERVGELLENCEWVGVGCAGGMCEIPFITARTIVVNDLHRGIINLAEVVDRRAVALQVALGRQLFHPDTLRGAQERFFGGGHGEHQRALDYFTIAWMTRSGTAGTDAERTGKLALRWTAGGGDSAKRYHSAIVSLPEWSEEFRRCTFSTLDLFEFLDNCKDRVRHGIYIDPPFIEGGEKYTHKPEGGKDDMEAWHRRLEQRLQQFWVARVVVRAYDCEFVRECYSEKEWRWHTFEGRKQTNETAPEVLLVRN